MLNKVLVFGKLEHRSVLQIATVCIRAVKINMDIDDLPPFWAVAVLDNDIDSWLESINPFFHTLLTVGTSNIVNPDQVNTVTSPAITENHNHYHHYWLP